MGDVSPLQKALDVPSTATVEAIAEWAAGTIQSEM
jgi:hypothetical protein